MRISALLPVTILALGCGEIIEGSLEPADMPDSEDVPAIVTLKPSCTLLVIYVNEWEINRIEDSEILQGFAVIANQSDAGTAPIDISNLFLDYIGDTHAIADIDALAEPWIGQGFALAAGEQVGLLTPSSESTLSALLPGLPFTRTENLTRLEISQWRSAADFDRTVSVELAFIAMDLRIQMQMRFKPGEETRPLAGAYACAVRT